MDAISKAGWPALSNRIICRIRKYLYSNRIEWLPLWTDDPYLGARWSRAWRPEPLEIGTLQDMACAIWFGHSSCLSMGEDRHVTIAYIDGMHMLSSIRTNVAAMRTVAEMKGVMLPEYGEDELEEIRRQSVNLSRLQYDGINPMPSVARMVLRNETPKNPFLVETIKAMRKLPTRIGGSTIAPHILKQALAEFKDESCLDAGDGFSLTDGRLSIGNAAGHADMTVMELIQTVYAYKLMTALMTAYKPMIEMHRLSPLYNELADVIARDMPTRDPWANDRLSMQDGAPFEKPDDAAYQVLTKINTPSFERSPGNNKRGTFDHVRVYLGLKTLSTCPNRRAIIRRYKNDLVKIAMMRIMQAPQFKRFGVPIQFYKPTDMTTTNADELEILFELKTKSE